MIKLLLALLLFGAANVEASVTAIVGRKTADQSKAADTTLAIDSQLQATMSAGDVFYFIFDFHAISASSTPDIKWTIDETVIGSTITAFCQAKDSGNISDDIAYNGFGVEQVSTLTANADVDVRCTGIIEAANASTVGFYWAQNASNATATIVEKNSTFLIFYLKQGM